MFKNRSDLAAYIACIRPPCGKTKGDVNNAGAAYEDVIQR